MKRRKEMPAPPPARKELSDTPIKFCNEISRLFRMQMRQNDTSEGVMSQPGAHLVLSMLAVCDGITQLELVKATHLRPPTVSVILQKMEAEGLVERKSDEHDRRAVRVTLTEAGRALDRKNIEMIRALDSVALCDLSEDEIAALMVILPKIRNNLLQKNVEKGEDKE
ncbi:MAG: winged helix-turn-helix transcriptional regulator [Clostridia bacterium]|nr:winged helix-turn-helix transcriptional regulator [Clostridia bacterium]